MNRRQFLQAAIAVPLASAALVNVGASAFTYDWCPLLQMWRFSPAFTGRYFYTGPARQLIGRFVDSGPELYRGDGEFSQPIGDELDGLIEDLDRMKREGLTIPC